MSAIPGSLEFTRLQELLAAGVAAGGGPLEAAVRFEEALGIEPGHPMAGLNLAEALKLAGRKDEAIAQARRALLHLERAEGFTAAHRDCPHYPVGRDAFSVEWAKKVSGTVSAATNGNGASQRSGAAETVPDTFLALRGNSAAPRVPGLMPLAPIISPRCGRRAVPFAMASFAAACRRARCTSSPTAWTCRCSSRG